jgi:hypothetical protein
MCLHVGPGQDLGFCIFVVSLPFLFVLLVGATECNKLLCFCVSCYFFGLHHNVFEQQEKTKDSEPTAPIQASSERTVHLIGKKFSVSGSWWPDSAVADKAKRFNLVVETFTMDHEFGNGNVAPAFRLKWIQVWGQLFCFLFGVLTENVTCFRLMTQKAPATRLLLRVCTFGGWECRIFLMFTFLLLRQLRQFLRWGPAVKL